MRWAMVNLPVNGVPTKYQFISTIGIAVTFDGNQIEIRRAKQWLNQVPASGINSHMDGLNSIGNPAASSAAQERSARAMPPVSFPNEDCRQFQ